jgi:hypothetical protein
MLELELFNVIWWIIFIGVMLAAFIHGVAGFAFALFLTPILLIFTEPHNIVVINLSLSVFLNILNIIIMRNTFIHNIKLGRIIPIAVGSLCGMPLGAIILKIIDPSILKILIGSIIIIFAILMSIGYSMKFKNYRLSSGVAGLLSGVLMTSTSLGGPPVVLFMHGQKLEKNIIYCNLILYWLFLISFSLLTLIIGNVIDTKIIYKSITFIPALLIGLCIGIFTFHRINILVFRYVTIIIIIISGIIAIASETGLY